MDESIPKPYCLLVKGIREIKELDCVSQIRNNINLNCFYKFHLSFFNPSNKRFLGETYESPLHEISPLSTFSFSSTFSNFVYFLLPDGENISIVLEIVFVALNKFNQIHREIGLGFSYLHVSELTNLKDLSDFYKTSFSRAVSTLDVFRGTPRSLLFNSEADLFNKSFSDVYLDYCCFSHSRLLNCLEYLPLYTFLDERNGSEAISGLVSANVIHILSASFAEELNNLRKTLDPDTNVFIDHARYLSAAAIASSLSFTYGPDAIPISPSSSSSSFSISSPRSTSPSKTQHLTLAKRNQEIRLTNAVVQRLNFLEMVINPTKKKAIRIMRAEILRKLKIGPSKRKKAAQYSNGEFDDEKNRVSIFDEDEDENNDD